ncbi:MAG: DUF2059 domain-containing protein [Acidobacteriaceae bacterium]|nr:DUF2059 domain-containing protein [Acidobacteriaceae bacterium]
MKLQQLSAKLLLFCLFSFSLALFGQSAPSSKPASVPAIDPKKAALIEELFRITKPETLIEQALGQYKAAFSQAATQGFNQEVRKFDDPAKYQADFSRLQERVFNLLNQRLNWQKIKPQYMQAYSDTFSTDELSGMLAFYRSPAGQAYINKTPGLMAKFGAIGQQQMAGTGPEIQKMMNDFMADLKKRSDASHANAPAKK